MCALVLGLEPLDAERAGVVEDPDAERLAADAGLGRVVDDRLAVLDRHDPGVRELAAADVGDEPAERELPAEDPGVAAAEEDVAVSQDLAAPRSHCFIAGVIAIGGISPDFRAAVAAGPQGLPCQSGRDQPIGRLLAAVMAAVQGQINQSKTLMRRDPC